MGEADQEKLLEEAIHVVKSQAFQMKRSLVSPSIAFHPTTTTTTPVPPFLCIAVLLYCCIAIGVRLKHPRNHQPMATDGVLLN